MKLPLKDRISQREYIDLASLKDLQEYADASLKDHAGCRPGCNRLADTGAGRLAGVLPQPSASSPES